MVHLIIGIKFGTPSSRHARKDSEILNSRKKVYEEEKLKNPNRYARGTRNWNKIEEVFLNYLQKNDMSLATL